MLSYGAFVLSLVTIRLAWKGEGRFARWGLVVAALGFAFAVYAGPRGSALIKFCGLLAMPLGLLFAVAGFGAFFAWWRDRPRVALGLCALHLVVGAIGSPALAVAGLNHVEGRFAQLDPFEEGPFDAVIVLGGGTSSRPTGGVQVAGSGDRVITGARLYHRDLTPRLVTSGSPIPGFSAHDSAAATETIWRELGVPEAAIVRVDGALTTTDEARLHAALIEERGWQRVGLVTSASHMQRALRRFEAESCTVVPLPADVRGGPIEFHGLVSLVPRAAAASTVHRVAWELLGRTLGR